MTTSGGAWSVIERPGYFGARRDEIERSYDERYGSGRWRVAWYVGGRICPKPAALVLYEAAYDRYFDEHPELIDRLVDEASEVYDDAPTNIASGLDYTVQETGRTHLQDIAIRRCLVRRGRWFAGSEPIQIRDSLGDHPLSMTLSPGQVPFHLPRIIREPEIEGWWATGSVESFYQSNKVLQARIG